MKKRIKASSLLNALIISLVLAVISSGMISLSAFNKIIDNQFSLSNKIRLNLNSGFLLLESDSRDDFSTTVDLFETKVDSVFIKK